MHLQPDDVILSSHWRLGRQGYETQSERVDNNLGRRAGIQSDCLRGVAQANLEKHPRIPGIVTDVRSWAPGLQYIHEPYA